MVSSNNYKNILENRNFLFFSLLTLVALVRLFTVIGMEKIPCMDPYYIAQGKLILDGVKVDVLNSAGYSLLIQGINTMTNNLLFTSAIIFAASSVMISYGLYKYALLLYNRNVALTTLLLSITIPFLSIQSVGYSHTVYLSAAFTILSFYFYQLYLLKNNISALYGFLLVFTFGTFIRHELFPIILLFAVFSLLLDFFFNKKDFKEIFKNFLILIIASIILIIAHKYFILFISKDSSMVGIFSHKYYSYITWLHTFAFKAGIEKVQFETMLTNVNDEIALIESSKLIGSPELYNYSVIKAIIANPSVQINNSLFNLKNLFINFSYPSLLPFYLYVFVGFSLIKFNFLKNYQVFSIFFIIFLFCAVQIVFHSEVRFLIPSAMFILVFISHGISILPKNISYISLITIFFSNLAISSFYFSKNLSLSSSCGINYLN